jgi:hypothetical protein
VGAEMFLLCCPSALCFKSENTIFSSSVYKDEDESTQTNTNVENGCVLPWVEQPNPVLSAEDITSGEFVLRTLFAEFTVLAERKIDLVLAEPLVSLVSVILNISKPLGFYQSF